MLGGGASVYGTLFVISTFVFAGEVCVFLCVCVVHLNCLASFCLAGPVCETCSSGVWAKTPKALNVSEE